MESWSEDAFKVREWQEGKNEGPGAPGSSREGVNGRARFVEARLEQLFDDIFYLSHISSQVHRRSHRVS